VINDNSQYHSQAFKLDEFLHFKFIIQFAGEKMLKLVQFVSDR